MLVSDFDYNLPANLIAQEPAPRRDCSRLLVVDRATGTLIDTSFEKLPEFLRAGDVLVLNNTKVFPARLMGRVLRADTEGHQVLGASVEVFLVRRVEPLLWETLVKPGRALPAGARVAFFGDSKSGEGGEADGLTAEVVQWLPHGRRIVRFHSSSTEFDAIVDRLGRTPLPPYIKRRGQLGLDSERYQTVYARERGSIAAPTAGLHFTDELLGRLRSCGVNLVQITLHVGYGTFQPVRAERVEDHQVESEAYSIDDEAADRLSDALARGRRIIAVGTTTTRALESAVGPGPEAGSSPNCPDAEAQFPAGDFTTDLFVYPGYEFRVLGGLVTNFHLPRSSLLMLVSAFGGRDLVLRAYQHSVEHQYRFYSYGDAMLIV
jgi:S-adenosylmethionine:tRNA ribosyltransferase-isomerase